MITATRIWYWLIMGPLYYLTAKFLIDHPSAIIYAIAIIALVIWGRSGENHAKK